jgi:DNA-binding MarR family transcriptional regulator
MEVEALVTRLSKIHRYLERILGDTARDHGISHGEFKVLVTLKGAGGPSTPGELSDKLLVSSGAMTNRLDRLESAGLVRRDPDPADRRGVLVSLTDEGDGLIERAVYQQARKEQEALAVLDDKEKAALEALLRKVTGFLLERYGPPRKRPHDEP